MADKSAISSSEAPSPAAQEAKAFLNIPDDIAKAMPEKTREEFTRRENFAADWEKNLTSARSNAESELKASGNNAATQELYEETLRKINYSHTYPGGLDDTKKALLREEADYTDMARRTFATADRNNMDRPQVGWVGSSSFEDSKNAAGGRDYGESGKPSPDASGVDNQGKPIVIFGAKLVDGLSQDGNHHLAPLAFSHIACARVMGPG